MAKELRANPSGNKLYQIISIGPYQYLLYPESIFTTRFEKTKLWTLKNDDTELNIFGGKDSEKGFFAFGKSDTLKQILKSKGVEHEVLQINSSNEELSDMELEPGIHFEVEEKRWEGSYYFKYEAYRGTKGLFEKSQTIFKCYMQYPPAQFVNEPVSVIFEGGPDADGVAPVEVRNFLVEVSDTKFKNNLKGCLILIVITILLIWLMV